MKNEFGLYELVLLIKCNNVEQETANTIERYRNFLTDKGSKVMVKNHGKISLAYPLKGFDTANSIQMIYLGNGDLIKQLNTELYRDNSILRVITTKLVEQDIPEFAAN